MVIYFYSSGVYAERIKEPNVAGAFYPLEAKELSDEIDSYFASAGEVSAEGKAIALVVPHAGYVYSGPVAAYGYKALKGKTFDLVVILGVSHFYRFNGVSVYGSGSFKTPLGQLEVDSAAAERLIGSGSGLVIDQPLYFEQEHSIEVELPFLQKTLPGNFKILPLLAGSMDHEQCGRLADLLVELSKERNMLLIASSDLSHYKSYEEALKYDRKTVDLLRSLDSDSLWRESAYTGWNVCGIRPVMTTMLYAKKLGSNKGAVLKYANSGDTAGGKDRVVGYVSAIFLKDQRSVETRDGENMLTENEKKRLLEIARSTIQANAGGQKIPVFDEKGAGLNLKRGLFVTLRKNGELRGCIGTFTSEKPLYRTVQEMAVESSSHDFRFPPVSASETADIKIEISILTEPQLIDDWKKIRLGIDGVIVRKGFSSGVFLPQVATETGWGLETFLGQLCYQKAGLPSDCYKEPGTKLYTFQAVIFSED